jgi:hypothetical protein
MGIGTSASGGASAAFGAETSASGLSATAMGANSVASGAISTAFGANTTASGNYSTATGRGTTASGSYSTAAGFGSEASGTTSTALGYSTEASGTYSTALGYNTSARGDFATALGSNVAAIGDGCFVIGDISTSSVPAVVTDNIFLGRFANGYELYTNSPPTVGAKLAANATSWSSISDSTKKENFQPVEAEDLLTRFRTLRLGTWNFIGQDPTRYRHYGPMAQEWFAAFGHDGIGTIGDDTTLTQADVDGVLCIAIQALEKRTADLQEQLTQKEDEIALLKKELASVRLESERRYETVLQYVRTFEQDRRDNPQTDIRLVQMESE